jgi:hypothetical protein
MNRLTNVQWLFRSRTLVIRSASGRRVLLFRHTRDGSRETIDWWLRSDLQDCARNIDFNVEVDPEHVAPPCPA